MKLTNKSRRRLGISGRPALILEPDRAVEITQSKLEEIKKNKTVARWLDSGVLVLDESDEVHKVEVELVPKVIRKTGMKHDRDKREEIALPEGVSHEGIQIHHAGGGWYELYVNGFKVTDKTVRKDEAESMATEYEE